LIHLLADVLVDNLGSVATELSALTLQKVVQFSFQLLNSVLTFIKVLLHSTFRHKKFVLPCLPMIESCLPPLQWLLKIWHGRNETVYDTFTATKC
jgi:hypothetical protein